jgi:hypothetical protein
MGDRLGALLEGLEDPLADLLGHQVARGVGGASAKSGLCRKGSSARITPVVNGWVIKARAALGHDDRPHLERDSVRRRRGCRLDAAGARHAQESQHDEDGDPSHPRGAHRFILPTGARKSDEKLGR